MARQRHRGFSIVEVVVVTALVTLVAGVSLVWFGTGSQPDTEATAKTSLTAYLTMQNQALTEGSPILDATTLNVRDYTHTYTSEASTGPQEISTAVSGTLGLAAVSSGGGACWMVRFDAAPVAGSPPVVWYLTTRDPCTAADVTTLIVPGPGEGSTPGQPVIL